MLTDSHAHLDFLTEGRTIKEVLFDAQEAGINKIICIGTSIEASKKSIEISEKYSGDDLQIYATCGIHPQDGKSEVEKLGLIHCFKTLKQAAQSSKKVVALGECGLDYYTDPTGERPATTEEEKGFQRELFKKQIKLAADLNLPLVVHCRNAWDEVFEILEREQGPTLPETPPFDKTQDRQSRSFNLRGVFHSWTGNVETMKKALEIGFYISFSGIVTFKNAQDIQESAKIVPLDRILIETDSPFLAPEPLRGKQNEPKNVRIIAAFLASLRNEKIEAIEKAVSENFSALFL